MRMPLGLALSVLLLSPFAPGAAADEIVSPFVPPPSFRPFITEPVLDRPATRSCQVTAISPGLPRNGVLLAQNTSASGSGLPRDSYGLPGNLPDKRTGQRALPLQAAAKGGERDATLSTQRLTAIEPTTCDPPVTRTQFAHTDQRAWHFLSVTGAAIGDTVVWEWYRPDGTRHDSSRLTLSIEGGVCMWAGLNIAGTSAANLPGTWSVRILYNNASFTSSTFTITAPAGGGNTTAGTRVCRNELSLFYQGAHSVGTAWVRPVVESFPMSTLAISQIQGALDNLLSGVNAIPCIVFDRTQITALSSRIPSLTPDQSIRETEALIRNLQTAVRAAELGCDNGVNLESLYVVGVHLGAAIAWANSFLCDDALPAGVTGNIRAHLETARQASAAYRACSGSFDSSLFTTPNLAAPPREIFTELVGLYNLYLWNISLSECCCTCGAGSGGTTTGGSGAVGIVSGTVRNASNGQALSGARVTIAGTSLSATTAADGAYSLREVPAGTQRIEAAATGFISNTANISVTAGQTLTQNISLSPTLQTGEIRITLNWTKTAGQPNDLDMHLIAPQPNSTSCSHIYYSSSGSLTASPFAQLEVDNIGVAGSPPTETIRISRLTPGIYRFYVHNYSGNNTSELSASRAAVQVFGASGQLFSQSVPSGQGFFWSVFTLDGTTGAITPASTVGSTAPPATCR